MTEKELLERIRDLENMLEREESLCVLRLNTIERLSATALRHADALNRAKTDLAEMTRQRDVLKAGLEKIQAGTCLAFCDCCATDAHTAWEALGLALCLVNPEDGKNG